MSSTSESNNATERNDQATSQTKIPPLGPVTPDVRELWEDFRNAIETKAQKYFPMPVTFQMVPVKMSVLNTEGQKTYFFKARIPNNRFVNVRVKPSGKNEPRENQVAVEKQASGSVDEEITNIF